MPKGVEHCKTTDFTRLYARVESLMPKGVEHTVQTDLQTDLDGVESLMPKGVEHYALLKVVQSSMLCRISDAERR